jgi:hypothetical protein
MVKNPLLSKGLAVGIILLFIGVTIAPNINFPIVKASNDKEIITASFQENNSAIYNKFCFFFLNATRANFDNIYLRISIILSRIGLQNLSMRFYLYGQYKSVHLMNRIVLSGPFSISTVGLLGKKSGTFYADLMDTKWILGFTGISTFSDDFEYQYIFGYARRIMIPT